MKIDHDFHSWKLVFFSLILFQGGRKATFFFRWLFILEFSPFCFLKNEAEYVAPGKPAKSLTHSLASESYPFFWCQHLSGKGTGESFLIEASPWIWELRSRCGSLKLQILVLEVSNELKFFVGKELIKREWRKESGQSTVKPAFCFQPVLVFQRWKWRTSSGNQALVEPDIQKNSFSTRHS